MKLVIAHRSGEPRVIDVPEPRGGRNFVTVRVSHAGMALPGELELIAQARLRTRKGDDGIPLGGHASGVVLDVGAGVKGVKEGIRVAVTGSRYVYHAGQVVVPEESVVELPKKVNHEEGAFVGMGASALNLVRAAHVQLGEVVLVIGADLRGLIVAQLVRAAGAIPVLVDESDFRLAKVHPLGITNTFAPDDEELVRALDVLTNGLGADCALITRAKDGAGIEMAMNLLRHRGTLVLGEFVGAKADIDILREKAITLTSAEGGGVAGSRWTERENMTCFCNLLADRKIQISPLITDRVPLERAPTIYEKAQRNRDAVVACVLTV
ncbi:MAG TPA: zinc-binding dehydrogenase [Candidatus Sumerlaeota bacterium]|nr:zinc-binding dehydrogenase [Candidatus Sumerlaeota bacterium]